MVYDTEKFKLTEVKESEFRVLGYQIQWNNQEIYDIPNLFKRVKIKVSKLRR